MHSEVVDLELKRKYQGVKSVDSLKSIKSGLRKKKGNQTPVVHGGFKSEEIIRKALASKGLSLDEFRRPM